MGEVIHGDNLPLLRAMPSASVQLIYIDPPFNTGKQQHRHRMRAVRDDETGDRVGFGGKRYRTELLSTAIAYLDCFDDFLAFLEPRLIEAHRILTPTGSLFLHIDYREAHYVKLLLDSIFGRECLQNEIIWAYDYGARPKRRWPTKHDTLFWYTRDPKRYTFHLHESDRIPYMAPTLVGKAKAARGKTPTDVWWHTIVSPTGREKTGYPTQKPLGILERIVRVHSNPGDTVLDFFAGSGTAAEAAARNDREFIAMDQSREAIALMRRRLAQWLPPAETPIPKRRRKAVADGVVPAEALRTEVATTPAARSKPAKASKPGKASKPAANSEPVGRGKTAAGSKPGARRTSAGTRRATVPAAQRPPAPRRAGRSRTPAL